MREVNLWLLLLSVLIIISCRKLPEEGGYQLNPTLDDSMPDGVYIPKDLDDAHRELKNMLPKELISEMKRGTEDDMVRYHFGLGMWLRNNWGLWKGSRLSEYFNNIGIYHPDDMSGIILDTFWCHLNGKPQRLKGRITYYQEYWKSMETPKEGSPIDGAKIRWLIIKGNGKGTVHLGLSVSDKTGWRYEYGSGKGIEPATPEEDAELGYYRGSDFNLNDFIE